MNHTVAAFDFDGTLTYRDSLIFFLLYVFGPIKTLFNFILLTPTLLKFAFGLASRQQTKERVLNQFFDGMTIDQVREFGKQFATQKLDKHLRPEGMQRLKWHQSQGHKCLLVSASLDVYLQPWAEANGFDQSLTSRLDVQQGKVTGRLYGRNCRREEKVRKLEQALGPLKDFTIYAYGDSQGDKELLEVADHPFYRQFPKEGK